MKRVLVFVAVLALAACARTGDGIKNDVELQASTSRSGTKVFVKNLGRQLLKVTLNGVKVAELGTGEAKAVDALVGRNVLKLQNFGYFTSPNDGAVKAFSMEPDEKRFFVDGNEVFHHRNPRIILYRPVVIELRQTEFFGRRDPIIIRKFAPR